MYSRQNKDCGQDQHLQMHSKGSLQSLSKNGLLTFIQHWIRGMVIQVSVIIIKIFDHEFRTDRAELICVDRSNVKVKSMLGEKKCVLILNL